MWRGMAQTDSYHLRDLAPGDAGWIVHRHGVAIAPEFGWSLEFEALCAQILADFIKRYDATCEKSWIADRGGEILGSLFLIREDAQTARLRLLYVEPAARGLGLATRLLMESIAFARAKSYRRLVLFTTSSNASARRLYQKLGFTLTQEESFPFAGKQEIGETWSLAL